jgi:ribosomal RNA-processing protein 12
MGPDVVLGHIPLGITGNEQSYEFPRSWLLPVMRENVQKAKLSFFKSYFLPIATACYLRSLKAKKEEDKTLQKTYEVIVSQIW